MCGLRTFVYLCGCGCGCSCGGGGGTDGVWGTNVGSGVSAAKEGREEVESAGVAVGEKEEGRGCAIGVGGEGDGEVAVVAGVIGDIGDKGKEGAGVAAGVAVVVPSGGEVERKEGKAGMCNVSKNPMNKKII